jgi:hypothetical protein
MTLEFSRQILEKYQTFMKIGPVGAELFHAEGRTDMTKDNGRFLQFSRKHLKIIENRVTCHSATASFTSLSGTLGMLSENEWYSLTVGIFASTL